jgi:hypothetical protein
MIKTSKRELLITTVLFTLLLISSTFSLLPSTKAATVSAQDKTNSILNNVLNVDTSVYSTKLNSQVDEYGPYSETKTDITLTANQTSVRVSASFVNDTLHLLYLSEYTGTFAFTKPAIFSVPMAKDFLTKYQAYTCDSFYSKLASTLNDITAANNVTKTTDNIMLKVSNYDQKTVDYIWTYVDDNGVIAQAKNVILSYDQGRLKCFLNNWPLYKIADVQATISKEQAVQLALPVAENYTYQIDLNNVTTTISVAGFHLVPESLSKATLGYVNCPDQSRARNSDQYTLYPSWYIPLGFDKAYPGSVTGVAVRVWADTGEIAAVGPMIANGAYARLADTGLSQASSAIFAPIALGAILCMAALIAKSKSSRLSGTRKLFNRKFWTALLCLTIVSSFTSATVKAVPVTSSRIYAALDGNPNYPQSGSPPQVYDEKVAAIWLCGQIYNYFYYDQSGQFVECNRCQSGTTKQHVLDDAYYDEANYDRAIVFHFGHLANASNPTDPGYVDNVGTWITSDDISQQTTAGKHRFVFLWSCAQTPNMLASDMVYAWLKGDYGKTCFIGFTGVSPQIGNDTGTFQEGWTHPLKKFIDHFYNATIVEGKNIDDALNDASLLYLFSTYSSSPLNLGYTAWFQLSEYPDIGWWEDGQMHVLGNSGIHLVAHYNSLSISSSAGGYTTPTGNPEYLEQTIATVQAYNYSGYHFTGWLIDGWLQNTDNPIQICMGDDHTLQANFTPDGTTYTTTINVYYTWGGSPPGTHMYSYNIELPYGSNYLDFTNGPMGGYFMEAYNYADSSTHYSSADTYWTGAGTSIDVLWTW